MSPAATRVSVPGKLILMGEHAAVYGRPALVAALGLRMALRLEPGVAEGVHVSLPDLGIEERLDWAEVRATTSRIRRAWQEFADAPSPDRFRALQRRRPTELVAVALGETLDAVGDGPEERGHPCRRLHVAIESDIPVGSGFGSSAAMAVGLAAGYLATRRLETHWSIVERIALEVERRQHGLPSGIDAATVFHGGLLWCRRAEDGLLFEPLPARSEMLRRFQIFHTGPPAESTGEVVAAVRSLRDRDPAAFDARLQAMEDAARALQEALVDAAAEADRLIEPVRRYHRQLVALGVVPERVRRVVQRVENAGGAAKVSGAGSVGGPDAGSLIVVHPRSSELEALAGLTRHDVPLGVEGLRVESVA